MQGKKSKNFKVDFVGIGAPKCGTEWIVACLSEHPQVNFSKHKEINFFLSPTKGWTNIVYNHKRIKTWQKYEEEFSKDKGKIKGEFSNHYFFDKKALYKMKKNFPKAKVIFAIREPVSYLNSIYWYMRFSNISHMIPKRFSEAIKTKTKDDLYHYKKPLWSKYIKQCYDIFGKERTHIITLDEIKEEPKKTAKELFTFLRIDQNFEPEVIEKKVNPTTKARSLKLLRITNCIVTLAYKLNLEPLVNYIINTNNPIKRVYRMIALTKEKYPDVEPKLKKRLQKYYSRDIKKIEELTGKNLNSWKPNI